MANINVRIDDAETGVTHEMTIDTDGHGCSVTVGSAQFVLDLKGGSLRVFESECVGGDVIDTPRANRSVLEPVPDEED